MYALTLSSPINAIVDTVARASHLVECLGPLTILAKSDKESPHTLVLILLMYGSLWYQR